MVERELWLDALRGCPPGRVAVVTGEAGIGKTALVKAFCAGLGQRVLWGCCDALRAPRPLGPLHDMALQTKGRLAAALAADGPRHAKFTAFLELLAAQETVVVFEDLHWADEATVDLLVFVVRRISVTRALLVLTYRDDEVGADHPLRVLLGALATDASAVRARLAPLSVAAVAALSGRDGPDAVALHALVGGNPFFVTEVLADPRRGVPPTVRDAVLARVAVLGVVERGALEAVSVFPGTAPAALVQAPSEAVDGCVDAGMLVRDGAQVRFRHELARLAVEEGITAARRSRLHARALADLARRGGDPARLVHHAVAAGDASAVLVHAREAARRAFAVGAHRQAADQYRQAIRFADGLPRSDYAELLELYGEACSCSGRHDAAAASARQALELWRQEGVADREAALMARCSYYVWNQGDSPAAYAMARQALAAAEGLVQGPALAAAYTWSAYLLMLARDIPGALTTGARAVALSERFGERALLARALNAIGSAQWFDDPGHAVPTMLRSLEAASAAEDDGAHASALANLGSAAGEVRHYATAEHWLLETVTWCSDRDLDSVRDYAHAWLARCEFEQGRWSQAEAIAEQVVSGQGLPARIVALTVLGRVRTRQGRPGAAEFLDEAWALASRTQDLQRLWPVAAGRAELAGLSGQPTDRTVRETYETALRLRMGWAVGELGQWLRLGPYEARVEAAGPYRLGAVEAARAWDSLGCPYEAAMALARTDEHLLDARRRFEALGARPAADQVAERMRHLQIRAPRRSTLAHPQGLTEREAEVLGLLEHGLRNAQIAQRLGISEKTAGHHVSAILAKLGVRTRQQAARYGEITRRT